MVTRRAWLDFRIIYLPKRGYRLQNSPYFCVFKYTWAVKQTSSETQGQIVGARESLNGRKNKARRKEKNGEKSPWGQCLTRPVPNGRRCSVFWLVPEKHKFSGTLYRFLYWFWEKNRLSCSLERIKARFYTLLGIWIIFHKCLLVFL